MFHTIALGIRFSVFAVGFFVRFPSLGSAACHSKNFAIKKFVMGLAF